MEELEAGSSPNSSQHVSDTDGLGAHHANGTANGLDAGALVMGSKRSMGAEYEEDERVRRRREINRNSQKRIRERRNREMDDLRAEVARLAGENESLSQQLSVVTLEKAEMLRHVQELTEKWQQSVSETAWLNKENIQLRSSLQQLNVIVGAALAQGSSLQGATEATAYNANGASITSDGADTPGPRAETPTAAAASAPATAPMNSMCGDGSALLQALGPLAALAVKVAAGMDRDHV